MYISSPLKGKHTYKVYGYLGGEFTNYQEAIKAAKQASLDSEYDYDCVIWVDDSTWFDRFSEGKLVK